MSCTWYLCPGKDQNGNYSEEKQEWWNEKKSKYIMWYTIGRKTKKIAENLKHQLENNKKMEISKELSVTNNSEV